jgi:hypothetical protein
MKNILDLRRWDGVVPNKISGERDAGLQNIAKQKEFSPAVCTLPIFATAQ